jgi:hypothetical protein
MITPPPLNSAMQMNGDIIDSQAWRQWLSKFYDNYAAVGRWIDPYNPDFGKAEPSAKYKKVGLLAYANGTDWNPGSGAGHYRYDGNAWVYLG